MVRQISIFTLCMVALVASFQATSAAEFQSDISVVKQDTPPQKTYTQASTKIYTHENEVWFSKLIDLNPNGFIITTGRGISLTNPEGEPLKLPKGRVPRDVTLK